LELDLDRKLAAACKKEIEKVPGAAAAGEAVKEFLDLLLNASEGSKNVKRNPTAAGAGKNDKT